MDTTVNAQKLEEEYVELTQENVTKLHELLRPFFLRRTKAEVLDFLPPMAQIIVPVSLTSLQKKLYRSILAANPELLKSVFGAGQLKPTERGSLNNILMQLRKCLCHPFVYSRAIEQTGQNPTAAYRNLIEASSKLKLLEVMLPKLQERGHRVLIFSQFLDMLDVVEDFLDGLGLYYQRLDGSISALQKQRRIDEFNAPDSPLFAFLLSTRAGGVGINLATADTVIILDPDFNPHQDIQALSRAHRIGQEKKVLVFQLTTRGSAEEKIMQVGKKKMTLDHVLIEQLNEEVQDDLDLESILKYGTKAIFNDEEDDNIRYDSASVDKLLDRSQLEDTLPGQDKSAESQFSFARVWANDKGALEDNVDNLPDNGADHSVWDAILKEREREVAAEEAAKAEALGRGRRARERIEYFSQEPEAVADSPVARRKHRSNKIQESETDTDYAEGSDGDADLDEEMDQAPDVAPSELMNISNKRPRTNGNLASPGGFQRASVPPREPVTIPMPAPVPAPPAPQIQAWLPASDKLLCRACGQPHALGHCPLKTTGIDICVACGETHAVGYCHLKKAGVERCGLCGLAHYGHARTCPHLNSVTQCKAIVEAIKMSNEPQIVKDMAKKRIVGIIGDLNQRRRRQQELLKQKAEKEAANAGGGATNGENGVEQQGLDGANGDVNGADDDYQRFLQMQFVADNEPHLNQEDRDRIQATAARGGHTFRTPYGLAHRV